MWCGVSFYVVLFCFVFGWFVRCSCVCAFVSKCASVFVCASMFVSLSEGKTFALNGCCTTALGVLA